VPMALNPGELPPFEAMKRDAILDAYRRFGSIRKAAASLGIAKSTFADYLRRYLPRGHTGAADPC